jgi:predicted kinase
LAISHRYSPPVDAISVTGLQGTGKTTLAKALGKALDATVISRDPLMDALLAGGVPLNADPATGAKGVGELGYDLQATLLRTQLEMGQSVVLECVVGWQIREQWRQVAESAGATYWLIDTVCSDPKMHRQRFEARGPTQRGDWILTWDAVEANRERFKPHPQAAYVADAVRPVEDNVAAILEVMTKQTSKLS